MVPYQVSDGGISTVTNQGATSADGVPAGRDVSGGTNIYSRGGAMYAIEVATLTGTSGALTPDTDDAGTVVWSYDHSGSNSTNNNADLDYSIASDMTTGDLDNDGFTDVIYVGDTGGRMWRFDVGHTDVNFWEGNIIFNANPGYEDFYTDPVIAGDGSVSVKSVLQTPTANSTDVGRKFFYKPAVAVFNGKAHLWFGSGDRAHPLNHAVVDRLYKVVDNGQTTIDAISEAHLVDLTDNPLQSNAYDVANVLAKLQNQATGPTGQPDYYQGWMIKLDLDYATGNTSTVVGEKVLASPVMFNNEAYYTTYAPSEDPSLTDPCAVGNLGESRLYHVSARTGEAVFNYDISNDSDTLEDGSRAQGEDGSVLKRSDRVRTLGQGIPSGIVTLIDASGRVTMMISSSNRVETYNAPDIKLISPVYWMQW